MCPQKLKRDDSKSLLQEIERPGRLLQRYVLLLWRSPVTGTESEPPSNCFFQTHGTQRNRNPRVVEVSSKLISRLDVGGSHITTLISPDETFNKQFKTSTQAAQSLPETRCVEKGADVTLGGGCVTGNCNTSRPPSKVTVAFDSTQRHT